MRRIVSVWFPSFAIDRLRRAAPAAVPDERTFALVEKRARGIVLTAVNAHAWRHGLRPGLALADARAAFPDLATRPAEPARDAATLAGLAQWAGRYGPLRNTDGADGLWIDVTGVAHLYGGEAELAGDLGRRLAALGFHACVALAGTHAAADALARFAARRTQPNAAVVAASADTARMLAGLPVAALRIDAQAVLLLQRLGLGRIGQLYDLPRASLARRFRETARAKRGQQDRERLAGAVLDRLDAALGRSEAPRAPLVEPPSYVARRLFAEPLISGEGIAAALSGLADELCAGLGRRAEGARRFELALYRADATWASCAVGASTPTRDARHVVRLIGEKLAGVDAGFGVDALVLAARGIERVAAAQVELGARSGGSGRADPAVLVDRLSSRLGAERVVSIRAFASHLPERAQRFVPALHAANFPLSPHLRGEGGVRGSRAGISGAQPWAPISPDCPRREDTGRHRVVAPHPRAAAAAAPLHPLPVSTGRGEVSALCPSPFTLAGPPRPPLLLMSPEPITVVAEVPEGPPARFTWRRVLHTVVRAEGPERLAPEWWLELASAVPSRPRDYYRIEDAQGGRFWVFRDGLYQAATEDGPPRWFMHGLYG